jgi:ABC-type nitrate/sulfonate/bicarbonate transport system permease component
MRNDKMRLRKALLPPVAVFIGLLLLWEAFVWISAAPRYVLPAPSAMLAAFLTDLPALLFHARVTLCETLAGMGIAVCLGAAAAVLMDAFAAFKAAVYPLFVVSQTIPVVVLAPVFIIYLGFGMAPKVLTVTLMCFFPIAVSFADGMSQVDPRLVDLVRALGARTVRVYMIVKIPAAAVSLFSGAKVAATYSITGAVVGEWLSSDSGLGYYMLRVKNGYMLDRVFACVLAIVLLSLLMNGLVRLLKYLCLPHLRDDPPEKGPEPAASDSAG